MARYNSEITDKATGRQAERSSDIWTKERSESLVAPSLTENSNNNNLRTCLQICPSKQDQTGKRPRTALSLGYRAVFNFVHKRGLLLDDSVHSDDVLTTFASQLQRLYSFIPSDNCLDDPKKATMSRYLPSSFASYTEPTPLLDSGVSRYTAIYIPWKPMDDQISALDLSLYEVVTTS